MVDGKNTGDIDMKKKHTALVLQGGGAIGAYEYGVIKALSAQKDFNPSVVTGVSIGAINASVLVGAKNDNPVEALDELWQQLAVMDIPFLPETFQQYIPTLYNRNMYQVDPAFLLSPLTATSIYDPAPLYRVLEDLIDLNKLNQSKTWLVTTAIDVESGDVTRFENHNGQKISFDHIVASSSLPPGFPMTEINGKHYWDGWLFSNTPLRAAIQCLEDLDEKGTEVEMELIVVDLFPRHARLPKNMLEVTDRMLELLFTDKLSQDREFFRRINSYIDLLRSIDKALPEDSPIRNEPAFKKLINDTKIHKFTVIENSDPEPFSALSDFSKASIHRRIDAGYRDAVKQLKL